jgi:hypothetical protein
MNNRANLAGSEWRKGIATVLVLLGLAGCTHHPAMKNEVAQELELQKNFDLGLILDTTIPLHLSIPVTNRSQRTISILELLRDCACTSVSIDKRTLAPGETATLRVISNMSGKKDMFVADIIIKSDAAEKVDEIQIHGRITGQVRIRPAQATIVTGDRSAPGTFTVFCDDQTGKWRYAGYDAKGMLLALQLREKETTPTTSVYEGTVDLTAEARKDLHGYQGSSVKLTFINDHLDRTLDVSYWIEIAVRRTVTVDPPQVTFVGKGAEQRRTVLVQSAEGMSIDAARPTAPCLRTALRRVDARGLAVSLVFDPSLAPNGMPENLACELLSDGKIVGSIPVNVVRLP